jgi:hypothetical protein
LATPERASRGRAGAQFADLERYVRLVTADTYPAEMLVQAVCACGGSVFHLEGDAEAGCMRRICVACRARAFICDSGDRWARARPQPCPCRCGSQTFLVGVGFSFRADGDVMWLTVGICCTRCQLLGTPADWHVDYSPTDHLLEQV